MHLPDFTYAEMTWDSWRTFHITHKYNAFVQFDTGEFVVCRRNWSPDIRCIYEKLHLQVVATDDRDCPRLYVPGQDAPIPKSHLNSKGQQVILLDLDHGRAVGLQPSLTVGIPQRFLKRPPHSISVYYAGAEAMPVGCPVIRRYPQPLTHDQRQHINALTDACKVWLQMQPDPIALRKQDSDLRQRKLAVKVPVLAFVDTPFNQLTNAVRVAVAVTGFNMIVRESYPYLMFKPEEKEGEIE